ncbi:PMT family glycosyltransferase, 4-amino-4-deoxy-L-arabinose transferase [Frankia sp. AiPs1]|uniref:glycosyltransferase n=1 Tax=Frankia sp. AiPa1 TaxID=573492 RepID=UPI00202AF1CB|nr:glycosyltransferase [Frankia sp. AiPa1]MCL9758983.1 glycosyltransferase [Frankia sp. AiPa1]
MTSALSRDEREPAVPPTAAALPGVLPAALPGVLVGWCALAWGIAAKDGRYGAWAMAAILIGTAATTVAVVAMARARPTRAAGLPASTPRALGSPAPTPRALGSPALGSPAPTPRASGSPALSSIGARVGWALVVATVSLGPIVRHPRYYAGGTLAPVADVLAILAGLLAAATILLTPSPRLGAFGARGARLRACAASSAPFWVVLGLACAAGVATIHAAPRPRIDVWYLSQVSASGLVHGADLYRQQWAPDRASYGVDGLFDVYPYLPWTTVLLAPARLLLGDVRYGLIAALATAAVCARRLGRPARAALPAGASLPAGLVAALPLLVVIFPESMYALQQSWTEPLLVACLAVLVLAGRGGHGRVAVVAFALALATKQHVALLLPLAAAWPAFGLRRTAVSAATALALVAPWVIAGPRDFADDAVWTNLHYKVLGHSLSVPGWASHFGVTLGFAPALVVLAMAYLLAWRARGEAAGLTLGGALVLLAADLMNKQTFFNHYTLPMGLLVLTAVLLAADGGAPTGAAPGEPGR